MIHRKSGFFHLGLKDFLGRKLLFDLGKLGINFLLRNFDIGSLLIDKLLNDHAVEDLAVSLHFLVRREACRVYSVCTDSFTE